MTILKIVGMFGRCPTNFFRNNFMLSMYPVRCGGGLPPPPKAPIAKSTSVMAEGLSAKPQPGRELAGKLLNFHLQSLSIRREIDPSREKHLCRKRPQENMLCGTTKTLLFNANYHQCRPLLLYRLSLENPSPLLVSWWGAPYVGRGVWPPRVQHTLRTKKFEKIKIFRENDANGSDKDFLGKE